MDGWMSVEDLVRLGFGRSRLVMANEAHDGLRRCVRTREVGVRMVRAAHLAGVRRMAMEALPWPSPDVPGPVRELPQVDGGYLAQPDMQALVTAALDLGWTLWAYEIQLTVLPADPAALLTEDFTNRREQEQAHAILRLLGDAPGEPLLVWCGNGHASREGADGWLPMGRHVAQAGADPFVIDQTVTVAWEGPDPWTSALLDDLGDVLTRFGGTAAVLVGQGPPAWRYRSDVDALVVSRENALT